MCPIQSLLNGVRINSIFNFLIVKELAKKTGDYLVLSKTDIEVIALTYQLYTEVTGTEPVIKDVGFVPSLDLLD